VGGSGGGLHCKDHQAGRCGAAAAAAAAAAAVVVVATTTATEEAKAAAVAAAEAAAVKVAAADSAQQQHSHQHQQNNRSGSSSSRRGGHCISYSIDSSKGAGGAATQTEQAAATRLWHYGPCSAAAAVMPGTQAVHVSFITSVCCAHVATMPAAAGLEYDRQRVLCCCVLLLQAARILQWALPLR
jgi:hypothetical protein